MSENLPQQTAPVISSQTSPVIPQPTSPVISQPTSPVISQPTSPVISQQTTPTITQQTPLITPCVHFRAVQLIIAILVLIALFEFIAIIIKLTTAKTDTTTN